METEREKRGVINAHVQRAKHGEDLKYYLDQELLGPPGKTRHILTISWTEPTQGDEEQTDDPR